MKKILTLSTLFLLSSFLFAQIRVGILNGPSSIPVAYMMENVVSINNQDLEFEKFSEASTLLPKLIKDEIDIGFLPPNVAAKVYNSSNRILLCCGITGEGNLSLISKDKDINSLSDLKGKTVYVAGQGATPDYMMRFLLKEKKIEIDSDAGVKLDFSVPTSQLVPLLLAGKIDYAVVPEPFGTIAMQKDSSVVCAVDLQTEYMSLTGNSNYPLTFLVVNRKYAEKNPEALKLFIEEYKKSYEFTVHYPVEEGRLCEKFQLGLNESVVASSIPYANYTFVTAVEAKSVSEKLFSIFLENNPASIGGKLPDEEFYLK